MPVVVPAQYVATIKRAANGVGLPYQICAAQAYVESGFNPKAVSPTGAQGFWQFEPGTFKSYGKGSPFNVSDETGAYINFMNFLLRDTGKNVRNALAAYNAGPGNIPAGLGYADDILNLAGSPQAIIASGNTTSVAIPSGPAPSPTDDDASWWIKESGQHFKDLAGTCNRYALANGRL